jgi:hypothetical protein
VTERHHPADPFELLCWQAAGHAIPKPPPIAGRVFTQHVDPKDETDPHAEAWAQSQEDGGTWMSRRSSGPAY